jgi:hypothetical protein
MKPTPEIKHTQSRDYQAHFVAARAAIEAAHDTMSAPYRRAFRDQLTVVLLTLAEGDSGSIDAELAELLKGIR